MGQIRLTPFGATWALVLAWMPAVTVAQQPVAIYYDGPAAPAAEGYLDAHQIQNLLGHFGLNGETLPIASYRAGQLASYRAAFFLGTASGTRIPAAFLRDIESADKPFCWIGRHAGQLTATERARRRFGLSYVDYRDDLEFREVIYRGVTLPKEDPDLNIVRVTDPASVEVVAEAVNDEKVRHPYALRRGRFWFIADTPFSYAEEGGRYLVFCDLLHDILEVPHPPQALALARIEDVSTEIDPADLRALANTLGDRRVPFQIAVIPVFRNPAKGFEVRLSDRPGLVDAVRYMVSRGGTPVLHGVTHQHDGASGDDYEFWDEIKNRPPAGDSEDAVLGKLELGLEECFANGIHPIAFETPHYAASESGYRALNQVFTLFNERTMATPDIGSIQYFPYPVTDRFGRYVVPENLGYLETDSSDPRVLIARARSLRVVRDAVASFYFHAFLDPALLGAVVDGITGLGYRFVSLRQFGGEVNWRQRFVIRTAGGAVKLAAKGEHWRVRRYDATGNVAEERVSSAPAKGAVEVTMPTPKGGWVAAECLKDAPAQARTPGLVEQVRRWWSRRRPIRRPLSLPLELAGDRRALVLWNDGAAGGEANNQQSYRTIFETFGYRTAAIRPADLARARPARNTVLVVPQAPGERLAGAEQEQLLRYLSSGGLVVADGRQPWLGRLGFGWMERRVPVSSVVDVLYPEMTLEWRPEEMVERFQAPERSQQLMVDPRSRQVLASSGEHGAGRFLHLAAPFDQHTAEGTSHYPYFPEYLAEAFRLPAVVTSPRVEVYFDPGFRDEANLNRLLGYWRRAGVRLVYAAAWQFYPRHTFDYANFVRLCHQNGLPVYAWFAFPAVTPRFWEEHPEWRERTAAGVAGHAGWRPAMNFQNPKCFRAAMDWMQQILEAHAWDGVNISELNYDADFTDYLRPDRFVPMNEDVRADFRARAGFDPALLFAPGSPYYHKRNPQALAQFLSYREDVVTAWHRKVLQELAPLQKERGWEVVVTMLDSLHSDYVRPALGVNSHRIVEMMKEFDFTLQVEDPAEHWMKPPDRYLRFTETYLRLAPDRRRLMFDINVMPDRNVDGTNLPSARATGTELARTVLAAASASGRAAIYSEYTVAGQDWALIGAALAGASRLEAAGSGLKLASNAPLRIRAPEDGEYYLNGAFWPAVSEEGVLTPPGKYRLGFRRPWYQVLDPQSMPARVLYASADVVEARATPTGVTVRYRSPGRAVLLLNRKPLEVRINGRPVQPPVEERAQAWALLVPRGENQVEVETTTRTSVLLGFWSWLSASAIAAFGAASTALMAAIYLHLRLRRAARRKESA